MGNKILFVILTCNRFYYFKNCLESILTHVDQDRIRILVCDNNTVEEGCDEYLDSVSTKNGVIIKKFTDRTRNELYRAMNWAVEFARQEKYKIINFMQDDYQYLFNYDKHIDDVLHIFDKHARIGQINVNLVWRRKKSGHGKVSTFNANDTNYAIMHNKRVVDNGFTRVGLYKKVGLYPSGTVSWGGDLNKGFGKHPDRYKGVENGEVWFGRGCERLGYKRCVSLFPNMGMIFDCAYVRGDIRMGDYFQPKEKLYFKPIADDQMEKLKRHHEKKRFSYIEDFCIPEGWKPRTYDKHSPLKKHTPVSEPARKL